MNQKQLRERLRILLDQEVITLEASKITKNAFERLTESQNAEEVDQAEMLFTHLPMTLSRIESGETVEAPSAEIMKEIKKSSHFKAAETQVNFIEKEWGKALPQEEKDYLYMHYTNIIQLLKGGEQ